MEHDEDWHGRLSAVAAGEPPVRVDRDEVVALAREIRGRRRRRSAIASAVVAVAAIAVGGALLTSLGRRDPAPVPVAAPSATATLSAQRTTPSWLPLDPEPCGLGRLTMTLNGSPLSGRQRLDLREPAEVAVALSPTAPADLYLQAVQARLHASRRGDPSSGTYRAAASGEPRSLGVTIPAVTDQARPVVAGPYYLEVEFELGGGSGACAGGHKGGGTTTRVVVRTG